MSDIPLESPITSGELDRRFHLRHGTASRAARLGGLKACLRRGRGGIQAWIMPSDALAWFHAGCPAEARKARR